MEDNVPTHQNLRTAEPMAVHHLHSTGLITVSHTTGRCKLGASPRTAEGENSMSCLESPAYSMPSGHNPTELCASAGVTISTRSTTLRRARGFHCFFLDTANPHDRSCLLGSLFTRELASWLRKPERMVMRKFRIALLSHIASNSIVHQFHCTPNF